MTRIRNLLLVVFVLLAGALLALYLHGRSYPETHHAEVSAILPGVAPETVYAKLIDTSTHGAWRRAVASIEPLPDVEGQTAYTVIDPMGDRLDIVRREAVPPTRIVTEIADPATAGFGGTWTTTLAPAGDGTRVVIAEDGVIPDPMMRAVYWMIATPDGMIQRDLEDLQRAFETPSSGD